jgi:hypothetical protein
LTRSAKPALWKQELPLPLQYAALFLVWIVWIAAAALVWWKARRYARYALTFADPGLVYGTVLSYMPLVVMIAGALFLLRARPVADLPRRYRILYRVVAALTLLAGGLFLTCGI